MADMEGRRQEALEYLVKNYYESKIHEQKLRKKLESYGRLRRWVYRRSSELRVTGMIFKQVIIKPVGIALCFISGWLTPILAFSVTPGIVRFIDSIVPVPYNAVVDIIVTFPIPFSPLVIAWGLYIHHLKKVIEKRLKEDYGIET